MTPKTYRGIASFAPILACLLFAEVASAGGFSALVSPPHFEASVKPGTTYRNAVEIDNVSPTSTHYNFKTNDWALKSDGSVVFSDELTPGSCRPWVSIEAPDITMGPNGKRHFRFEIAVPADAPSFECRFAIMIEGDPETVKGAVNMPVSGRIGVVVYLDIGDAVAKLEITDYKVKSVNGHLLPVLSVRNSGTAHGRLQGIINGKDASGHKYAFDPNTFPVMAGETREIELTPQGDNDKAPMPTIVYPLHLKGRLDWQAQHLSIDTTFTK